MTSNAKGALTSRFGIAATWREITACETPVNTAINVNPISFKLNKNEHHLHPTEQQHNTIQPTEQCRLNARYCSIICSMSNPIRQHFFTSYVCITTCMDTTLYAYIHVHLSTYTQRAEASRPSAASRPLDPLLPIVRASLCTLPVLATRPSRECLCHRAWYIIPGTCTYIWYTLQLLLYASG